MPRGRQLTLVALLALGSARAAAQESCAPLPAPAPLAGDLALHRTHVRADSAPPFACGRNEFRWSPAAVRLTTRSGVPDGRGSGSAPAMIGSTLQARAGFEVRLAKVQVRVAPEVTSAANGDFPVFPGRDPGRSPLASPFYVGDHSADIPSRFGDQPLFRIDPGETGAWYIADAWSLAVTTGLHDWGPGVGEGMVLGRSSAGLPRGEFGVWRPLLGGLLRARWLGGVAVESRFFDGIPTNDLRSVSGARITYERSDWTLGFSRTVMDGRQDRAALSAALRPFVRATNDSTIEFLAADLLLRNATSGTLAWMEVARQQPLRSFRDLTLMPAEGLAIRAGLSQRIARTDRADWIAGFEAVRLDQPGQRTDRDPQDLYTSPTVAQGWTHRGEPLGSGLGPGGQRQYLSIDREGRTWRFGGFVERARWNGDALYREFLPYPVRHDVTVQAGLRADRTWKDWRWDGQLSAGTRLNYLFQNADFLPGYRTDDVRVVQFSLSVTSAK